MARRIRDAIEKDDWRTIVSQPILNLSYSEVIDMFLPTSNTHGQIRDEAAAVVLVEARPFARSAVSRLGLGA